MRWTSEEEIKLKALYNAQLASSSTLTTSWVLEQFLSWRRLAYPHSDERSRQGVDSKLFRIKMGRERPTPSPSDNKYDDSDDDMDDDDEMMTSSEDDDDDDQSEIEDTIRCHYNNNNTTPNEPCIWTPPLTSRKNNYFHEEIQVISPKEFLFDLNDTTFCSSTVVDESIMDCLV